MKNHVPLLPKIFVQLFAKGNKELENQRARFQDDNRNNKEKSRITSKAIARFIIQFYQFNIESYFKELTGKKPNRNLKSYD